MEIYEKIYDLYLKLKDTFYCNCGYEKINPATIMCSDVIQFSAVEPFNEVIFRFEHDQKADTYTLCLYLYGVRCKFWRINNPEEYDDAILKAIDILRDENMDKYAELIS